MNKILIADDDSAIRQSIALILTGSPYELEQCGDLEQAKKKILAEPPNLILLDVHFGEKTSIDFMRRLASEGNQIPIIVLSGAASAVEAAEAIKLGAYDFIEKPLSADRLRLTIERCLENAILKQKFQAVTVQGAQAPEIIGKSVAADRLRKAVEQYARKDVRVLITGETGTGKEVVAQNLWRLSSRSTRPLLVVNSAAIPETLLESELFGHKKGSFTGAVSDQIGKIEMADRGTLFLDEIGDLSINAQTKLLRFLEAGEIQRVGSNQAKNVDVRLIAATSRDLEKAMEKGTFRADLYYRLNVIRIELSPLRDRKEDLLPLFTEFVAQYCLKFKEGAKVISPEVGEVLGAHNWPGNIRELRNLAERVVLTSGDRILKEHIVALVGASLKGAFDLGKGGRKESEDETLSLKEFKRKTEKEYIESILAKTNGSVTKAAQLLQIDRTYLHQKMVNHGIQK